MSIYPPIHISQKVGRWTVTEGPFKNKWGAAQWLCTCDCGTSRRINAICLKRKTTMSCGCLAKELTTARQTDHGRSYTKLYRTWGSMITRCTYEKAKDWHKYGGRGITVCDRWRESFSNFLSDMGEKPDGCQLDRIDNDGPYSLENCRWVTPSQNSRNRRNTIILTYNGESLPLAEWADRLGVRHGALRSRLYDGWSVDRTLSEPVSPRTKQKQKQSDTSGFEIQK